MKATAEKIAAISGSGHDRRLDEITARARRSDQIRGAVLTYARRREFFRNYDAVMQELHDLFVPPPLPLVQCG
jgi:hypothetical protein